MDVKQGCNCDEGFVQRAGVSPSGDPIPEIRAPMVHDCEYIRRRNAMIPAAERIAGGRPIKGDGGFSRRFMDAMEALWKQARAA